MLNLAYWVDVVIHHWVVAKDKIPGWVRVGYKNHHAKIASIFSKTNGWNGQEKKILTYISGYEIRWKHRWSRRYDVYLQHTGATKETTPENIAQLLHIVGLDSANKLRILGLSDRAGNVSKCMVDAKLITKSHIKEALKSWFWKAKSLAPWWRTKRN